MTSTGGDIQCVDETYPLSQSQQIIWLHETLFPDSSTYNFTATITITGALNTPALVRTMSRLLLRHEVLRVSIDDETVPPRQRFAASVEPVVREVDLRGSVEPLQDLRDIRQAQHTEPFDLAKPPPVRWTLARTAENLYQLVHTEHHIIHDGHSFAILLRDLFEVYRFEAGHTTTIDLPPPQPYSAALSVIENTGPDHDALKRRATELRGIGLHKPFENCGSPTSATGGSLRTVISPATGAELRTVARRHGQTPFAALLTIFTELIHRATSLTDFIIGSAVGNRPPGFDQCVGMFVNTIPICLASASDKDGISAANETVDTLFRALPYQHIPIHDITRELGFHSTNGFDNPLFNVLFSAHDARIPHVPIDGLTVSAEEGFDSGTSRFTLDVVAILDAQRQVSGSDADADTESPIDRGVIMVWDFSTEVFDRPQIEALARHFNAMVAEYIADPRRPMGELAADTFPAVSFD
jgi:hypothetical protein